MTECVEFDPLEYCALMQTERINYAVVFAMPLTKAQFERGGEMVRRLFPNLGVDDQGKPVEENSDDVSADNRNSQVV